MNLGSAIRLCRLGRGLSQAKLAELAGISVSYLSLIESAKRDPNFSTIETVAGALRIPVSVLVFLAADKSELYGLSPELTDKLELAAFKLIRSDNVQASLPE